jgi:5-methylcytosine-specific restriction endonuclease McrA
MDEPVPPRPLEEITFDPKWKIEDLTLQLKDLMRQRSDAQENAVKQRRRSLRRDERDIILRKTGGRCHICGGLIDASARWEADHVFRHCVGGGNESDNYLAAHGLCNTVRWDHLPKEMQWVMKIGVWARKQMEGKSELGVNMLGSFFENERRRVMRQKAYRQAPAPPELP